MMHRRIFLKKAGSLAMLAGLGGLPLEAFAAPELTKLTILHTNDVHSRIEAFPEEDKKRGGLGGAARRAKLIERIRKEEENVLLLDAGDMFQGTPYFNYFGGELEFKLMSKMAYDAATLGNHDFDAGLEGLHKQLPNANFSLINGNYNFEDTIMAGKTKPYQVFKKGKLRIGVLGVGIELEGLVPPKLFKGTRYLNPIETANKYAAILKHDEKCHYVICLSHLGYKYGGTKVSDIHLAQNSQNIDLILGGHTHTFMDKPDELSNKDGKKVLINQVGWAGLMLGRIDVHFEWNLKEKCITCNNEIIK